MVSIVTLHIYSGRPNPTWQLDAEQEKGLEERLQSTKTFSEHRPSGVIGGLGYRGFSITSPEESPEGKRSFLVHEGILDQRFGLPNLVDEAGVERFLVATAAGKIDDELIGYVNSRIELQGAPAFKGNVETAVACPSNMAADAPSYNPGMWNVPNIQPHNNCYNYANNNATNTFAQPGRATGHQATVMACSHVTPGAVSDGLKVVPNFSTSLARGAGWYVALVVWPNRDYHWYRQDSGGCWSHKPGQTAVRNVDNAGRTIADPKSCDRGPYSDFCDYLVSNTTVRIR